ncbi:MAG: desulfoferrodoxin [Verrucomicrobia bacterium]|nr:desulfoferrodoxin [Verrucomicrobiota bacterium]MBU4292228.1 desulfoferrodoxin [Verrucomicrobiota bacterium]MBU4428615.1 desulfoferrodoxin [Verrucomicrobiota bacterium]MCG2678394.1 desulfoferrodoxin [Kiritimatiellia bacterium]
MTKKLEIYKCEVCGNMVEMIHEGAGQLVCCGQPMRLFKENSVDASKEKHVPVIEKTATGIKVSVGSVPHPMEEKHYIEWIELLVGDKALRQFLKPGQVPSALFEGVKADSVIAREYCNLHGLWKA